MQNFQSNLSQKSQSQQQKNASNNGSDFNFSQQELRKCQSIRTFDQGLKEYDSNTLRVQDSLNQAINSTDNSFYSESEQIKLDQSLDDELILEKKVQKKDIVFYTRQFKESFVKYFADVIYGFLKQPTDLTFSIALDRLKYYSEQSPFIDRYSKTESDTTDKQDQSFNSNDSEHPKTTYSNSKTIESLDDSKSDLSQILSVETLLKSMFYQNQHQFMIYTFDYACCHLTFLAAMMYFWAKLDHTSSCEHFTFMRNFYGNQKKPQKDHIKLQKVMECRNNIFKTLKFYITQRSQSLNICQINILIVYFFLAHLKTEFLFQDTSKEISEIQQNFINNLKLYRRIKRMEKEFNSTENQVIFQSQLHKYEYENKLIESMEKTFLIFQFLTTHNFVSSPLQKYYELYEFQKSKNLHHLKKDYFCIWVMNIILRLCEKKSAESISKSAFYIINFLAILKKFKQNKNFQGISLVLPILYNIKQQLPKVWSHAVSRRKEINEKLRQYSELLTKKVFKKEDISQNQNAIISEDVIYQMCNKFQKYAKIDKTQLQTFVNLDKHKKFYDQFLVHIVYHRNEILQQYSDQIEDYKRQKEIGISFNMYLLDTYVCRSFKGTNSKILWNQLTEKSKKVNEQISYNIYIDIIDYCFVGSSLKYKQLDI